MSETECFCNSDFQQILKENHRQTDWSYKRCMELYKLELYGTDMEVVSDHKALKGLLKANKSNKTFAAVSQDY